MNKRIFSKNYKLLLIGNAVSDFGDILYSVAIGYWVYEKTNSTALMGIMSSISMFVQMFLLPISGTIIDRVNRKKVIVITDMVRGILMIGSGFLALFDKLSVPIVLFVSLLASFCSLFFNPAIDTILIDLLDKTTLVKGQSIFSAVNSFVSLSSKAISGIFISIFGIGWIIIINGLSFVLSSLSETLIKLDKREKQMVPLSVHIIIEDLKQGLISIANNHYLKYFMPLALIINLLGSGASSIYLAWILEKGFNIEIYGFVKAVETFAYLLGTVFLSTVSLSNQQSYYLFKYGFIIGGLGSILLYSSSNLYIIILLTIVYSLSMVIANSIFNAKMINKIPEDAKGSIIGFFGMASIGGSAMSSILYGFLSEHISITCVFIGLSLLSFIPLLMMVCSSKSKEFINH